MSKKTDPRSVVLPLVVIPLGGLVLLGALFMLYFGITRLTGSLLPREQVPIGIIRNYYALALLLIYLLQQRARLPELLNAILMIGPVAALIAAATFFLLHRYEKPWLYSCAAALKTLTPPDQRWTMPLCPSPDFRERG
jgi:hypothetical protein